MARKPNYKFERRERERVKAAKKAAKAAKVQEKRDMSDTIDKDKDADWLTPLNGGLPPESD